MRAVNLVPSEERRRGAVRVSGRIGPGYALLGALAIAVAFVTVYVLTNNTISQRTAQLATVRAQIAEAQAAVDRLASYAQFAKLAQAREQTVRQIASLRFDWHAALEDLSRVVPADTSLSSLFASVAPGSTSTGGASASAGALRGDISSPAFELAGCTKSQDDVARLISRLRLINGVTRVTLQDSQKQSASQTGAPVATAGSNATGAQGCGPNTPSFDLVVFFGPLPGATGGAATATPTRPVSATSSSSPASSRTIATSPSTPTAP